MGRQYVNRKETKVATREGIGQQTEQLVTYDDNALPSPQELEDYMKVDPRIVEMLLETSRNEQKHRHEMDRQKIKILRKSEGRTERINFWGMAFAFLSILAIAGLTAWALYLDRPWFAGFSGFSGLVVIISIFVNSSENKRR